jgi:hypothetical protein
MSDETIIDRLIVAVDGLWADACPVAGGDGR